MKRDRLDWIMLGLDWKKLNQFEKQLVRQIEKKLPENFTLLEEDRLDFAAHQE